MLIETSKTSENKQNKLKITNWLAAAACLILAVAVLLRLADFWQISLQWLPYPYWRPGSEGLVLDETLRVRHGLPIYGAITQTSFISGPYPPVFYYVTAFLMNFWGEGMLAGRVVSFASALACAALGGWLIWRESRAIWVAVLTGPLVLLTPPFLIWASRNRGDVLMVAFNLAGLVAVTYINSFGDKSHRKKWGIAALAIIFFTLAFYTKQTGLTAPLAATLWLLLQNWRFGLKWIGGLAVGLLLPFLLLEIVSNHEFYRHMVSYHALPWSWSEFSGWVNTFVTDNLAFVIIAVGFSLFTLGYWLYKAIWVNSDNDDRRGGLSLRNFLGGNTPSLSAWFVLFGVAGLVTTGVEGADHNHLLLPVAAVCVGTGTAIGRGLRSKKIRGKLIASGLILVIAAQIWLPWQTMLTKYNFDLAPQLTASDQTEMGKIINYIKTVNGPILSEEVALPALAGKESQVQYNDVYTMGLLAAVGKWNPAGLTKQVQNKYFAIILVPFDLDSQRAANHQIWPPSVLAAIKQNYQVKYRDIWYVYVPKS